MTDSSRSALLGATLAAFATFFPAQPGQAEQVSGPFADSSRIVAVGGSITEIVYALGEEKRLVARDSTSVYPQAAFSLPDVGYMRRLSPEGVLSVGPSAILALEGSGPKEAIDVLKKASVPYFEIPERFDRDGILDKVRLVGKALGVDAKAEELAASVGADLDAAVAETATIAERKRVVFVMSNQGGKLLAAGRNTAADGIIKLAGAVNVVDAFEGYKQLTDEALVEAQPDFILMMDNGMGGDPSAELFAHPAVAATPAGKERRLIRMDGAFLLGFGPRTAAAARDLARSLYGDQATD